MTLRSLLFLAVLVAAFGFFAFSVRRVITYLRVGKKEDRTDRPADRLRNVLVIAFGQTKLLREPLAGAMHFCIFWGFMILLLAIVETIGEGLVPGFTLSFLGPLYGPLAFVQDLLGSLVIGAVLYGAGTLLRTRIEDRLLRETFGAAFDDYARRVPSLLPWTRP